MHSTPVIATVLLRVDGLASQLSVRRKEGACGVLVFKPATNYLATIRGRQLSELEALSRECGRLPEEKLFFVERAASIGTTAKP